MISKIWNLLESICCRLPHFLVPGIPIFWALSSYPWTLHNLCNSCSALGNLSPTSDPPLFLFVCFMSRLELGIQFGKWILWHSQFWVAKLADGNIVGVKPSRLQFHVSPPELIAMWPTPRRNEHSTSKMVLGGKTSFTLSFYGVTKSDVS